MSDSIALCYHAISSRWPADLAVTPESFESQVRALVERGYRALTFYDAVMASPAARTMAITFDDAYRSVIDIAFPVMSSLGLTATVFVPTSFVGSPAPMSWPGVDRWLGGPHEAELRCMSWDDLGQLQEAGWEIGSHTHTHARLPTLEDDALARELVESHETCSERLGRPCRSLAYPFGAYDDRVVAAARSAGYLAAGTLPARIHGRSPLSWPRIGIYHGDTDLRFRAKVSPALLRLRASPVWNMIESRRRGFHRIAGGDRG